MIYTINLPLPARELSPNARTHWRVKAEMARKARSEATWAVYGAYGAPTSLPHLSVALVRLQCVFPDKRRRDLDNILAAMKPSIDGLVDSGLLADDSGLTWILPPPRVDKGAAGVIFTIEG